MRKGLFVALLALLHSSGMAEKIDFNKQIRPILSDKCFYCHGPDAHDIKGKLQLHTFESATAPRGKKKSKFALVPGNLEQSQIWERIITDDEDDIMPPSDSHKTLDSSEKALIKQWILEGGEYQVHWSYDKVKKPQQSSNIDSLIESKLHAEGLSFNKQAEKRTLIRRLSFDLRGLPPTRQEIDTFLQDSSESAWEKLIERFIGSPHYGEQMATSWLDLVRFADTVGYHGDQNQRVYPYRTYVINAFNKNKSFADFTREQLAGDLIQEVPSEEQLIASCYNRLNMMSSEGGAQPKEYLAKYAADRVRTTTETWMGSTLGCAECHDHKYDPFTSKDFYSFSAFFADIEQRGLYSGKDKKGRVYPPLASVGDSLKQKEYEPLQKLVASLKEKQQATLKRPELQKKYKTWLSKLKKNTHINSVTSQSKAKFTLQKDGSYLLSGKLADRDTYKISLRNDKAADKVLLSILPDPSFKNATGVGNGNFALTAIKVFEVKDKKKKQIKVISAEADYNQHRQHVNNALKSSAKTFWSVDGHASQKGKARFAIFTLQRPVHGEIEVHFEFNSQYPKHQFGRFKLELSPYYRNIQSLAKHSSPSIEDFAHSLPEYIQITKDLDAALKKSEALNFGKADCQITKTVKPYTTRIFPRGNWQDESGEVVQPAVPSFLGKAKTSNKRANRLDLANWLVSKDNPLTARVFVNRLWHSYFGRGLSASVEDVGSQGTAPDNPQLLDYLSWHFMNDNWDVKKTVKRILMSKAYRQSTDTSAELIKNDPYNIKLARQHPRRLNAESIRDNILKVSGLLNSQIGGASIKPYQPAGYYAQLNFPKRSYKADMNEKQYRRGIYVHRQRTFLHPMLKAFDTPTRETCSARRVVSNTPLQSLTLLNDPTFLEAARAFASKAMQQPQASRLNWMLEESLGRLPEKGEISLLQDYLQSQLVYFKKEPKAAAAFLNHGMMPALTKVSKSEQAAWTSVARLIFNLHELLTLY